MPLRRSFLVLLLILLNLFTTLSARAAGGVYIETSVRASGLVVSARMVAERARAYNGGRIVAEFNGAGAMTWRFVYGSRPQVPDAMIEVQSGQVYRLLTDHLGSVRLLVRLSDGVVVQQLAYDPWGAVETDTNKGFQPFGFAGGLYDPDTGLVRFGARDYDPAIGRWTTKDPSGFAGGTNLYAYAFNDPVNLIDLTGEFAILPIAAGFLEGAGSDLFYQMVIEGKSWECVDGVELAVAGIVGGITGGAAHWFRWGKEISFGKNFRIAPFGNRQPLPGWQPHKYGRWPHYHRRGPLDPTTGMVKPGQSIKRHRPWEPSATDRSFWDRF